MEASNGSLCPAKEAGIPAPLVADMPLSHEDLEAMLSDREAQKTSENGTVRPIENSNMSVKERRKARMVPIVPKVDDSPSGYPQLAAMISSDPNFVMYRQYKHLRHRCLLYKQSELAELERRLKKLDAHDEKHDYQSLKSRGRDDSRAKPQRKHVLKELNLALKEYDDLLFRTRDLLAMNPPTERNRASYDCFLEGRRSLVRTEEEYIKYNQDLVALGGDLEDSWLNGVVQEMLKFGSRRVWKSCFQSRAQKAFTDDEHIHYFDKHRIDIFLRVVMTFLITVLLMAPVFILSRMKASTFNQEAVILGSVLAFALILAFFTKCRRQEIFSATAAYCAVLIVFVTANSLNVTIAGAYVRIPNGTNATLEV